MTVSIEEVRRAAAKTAPLIRKMVAELVEKGAEDMKKAGK